MFAAGSHHRDNATIEQALADLKDSALAHLPSGAFTVNAAWAVCAAISHKVALAAGALASTFPSQRPHRNATRPADPHPEPDRTRGSPTGPTPRPGRGRPGSPNCSAAPCTTHSPPRPDHPAQRRVPTGDHQWESRTHRPTTHAQTPPPLPSGSTTEPRDRRGAFRLRCEAIAGEKEPAASTAHRIALGRILWCVVAYPRARWPLRRCRYREHDDVTTAVTSPPTRWYPLHMRRGDVRERRRRGPVLSRSVSRTASHHLEQAFMTPGDARPPRHIILCPPHRGIDFTRVPGKLEMPARRILKVEGNSPIIVVPTN